MRGVAILASILISVIAALGAASRNVSLILQPSVFTGGSSTVAIASAGPPCVSPGVCDLDGDGKMDLAVANYDTDDVSVLWGNGDGKFTPGASAFSVGSADLESPVAIAIADVNGDGNLDVITANEAASTVTALLGQGPGTRTFAAAKESPTGTTPEAIAVGDFNGDGRLDVATADYDDDTVSVLLGNGDGTFSILSVCSNAPTQSCKSSSECPPSGGTCDAQAYQVDVGPYALVAVDLDHNGTLDLVVANSSGGPDGYGSLTVLKGLGNGAFTCVAGTDPSCLAREITSSTFDDPVAIAVGQGPTDLNGDQNPDLVVVSDDNNTLSVLLGNGNLTFQDATALYLSDSSYPEWAVVADLNGDGIPDIASSASFLDKVSVFVGQGNGNFAAPVDFALPVDSAPTSLTAGDFNGDGTPDLGVADFTTPGIVSVLLNGSEVALAADISATDTSIALTESGPLPARGTIMIGEERIIYTGKQGNTLTGGIRGADGTVAAAHAAGAAVTFVAPAPCVGDCGETGSVGVEDIITMVDITLGDEPISDCLAGDANGDGQITVDEILTAVNNALNGCSA